MASAANYGGYVNGINGIIIDLAHSARAAEITAADFAFAVGTGGDPATWAGIHQIDDAELWETQQVLKAALIDFVRRRLVAQAKRRGEGEAAIKRAGGALELDALTIGFARRFATYKRAGLVLKDVERLVDLVNGANRPIQFIYAGKAHPEDHFGKELIQNIARIGAPLVPKPTRDAHR